MTSARMTRLGTSVEKPLTLHTLQAATPQVVGGASSERLRSCRTIPDLDMYTAVLLLKYGGNLVLSPHACVMVLSAWLRWWSVR